MIRKSPQLRKSNIGLAVLLSCSLVALVGCDSFSKKSAAPAVQAKVAPVKTVVTPLPPAVQTQVSSVRLPPAQTNQFDFSSKKDPFKPFVVVDKSGAKGKKVIGKDVLPIHSFDVSQFRLVGMVADPRGNKAMVVDPSGKAYVLRLGMTIGKNEGKITTIGSGGIDVVEQFRDENGKLRKETIRIPLLRKP